MRKLCIVPFSDCEYPLLLPLMERYVITPIVPSGVTRAENDVSNLRNRLPLNIIAREYNESIILDSDVVLISAANKYDSSLSQIAQNALSIAEKAGKEIWCFFDGDVHVLPKDGSIFKQRESILSCCNAEADSSTKVHKLPVPAIIVYEIIPNCDCYDVFLKLINAFAKAGKKVSAVSEDEYNSIFGQHTVDFWDNTCSSEKLLLALNGYFNEVVFRDMAEVLLVKLPLPIMKYDDTHPFDAGLTAYLISQAIPDSMGICCSYLGTPIAGFWNAVCDNLQAKFGMETVGIHLSNQIIDYSDLQELSKVYVSPSRVEREVSVLNSLNEPDFYDLLSDRDFNQFFSSLYNQLFDFEIGVVDI